MRLLDNELVCSPSDLTGFAACGHLTNLELAAARGELVRPTREDAFLDVLTTRGFAHEARLLDEYRAAGREVLDLGVDFTDDDGKRRPPTRDELEDLAAQTVDAMRAGVDVIAQGAFLHDGWTGYADFIERLPADTSDLGPWSYEVADAKLARRAKPGALVQLCVYSEQVARIQGKDPEHLHVLTGDGRRDTWRVTDALAYTRTLRERFRAAIASPLESYPEPVSHCDVCRWADECDSRRRTDDHLGLVAGMRRGQIVAFRDHGIGTRRDLAALDAPPEVEGIGAPTAEKLYRQARLQVAGDGADVPLYELLGLAALPPSSPGDLFVDFEGDPFEGEAGREYLLGVVDREGGEALRFRCFWAHDPEEERQAFEDFIDLIVETRARYPDMHVYHYAPYEQTALKRLMGCYGTREVELDELLRGNVFVDLYRVVRQSVRLSTESYGLKAVERLYLERSDDDVTGGVESIVVYENWMRDGRVDADALAAIEAYNRVDCESLVGLVDWLEERRVEAMEQFGPPALPLPGDDEASEELAEWEERRLALEASLTEGVPADVAARTPDEQGRWLLAQLLGWHRREDKPKYWRYFERLYHYDPEDFVDDTECIGDLRFVGEVGKVKRSTVYRYEFAPQDHKFKVGDVTIDPSTEAGAGTITEIGEEHVCLKRGAQSSVPHPVAIIPRATVSNVVLRRAIAAVADEVAASGIDGTGSCGAARALLRRSPPGPPLVEDGETTLDAAQRLVLDLSDDYLPIQGPPGSGKTYTGAHMIVTAITAGLQVGVTANSHAVVTNLLDAACEVADERHVEFACIQKFSKDTDVTSTHDRITPTDKNEKVETALVSGAVQLVGGSAWLWTRDEFRSSVDVLFIDEAGQMSLANTVAVSTAASGLVLLGDPQQLSQPSQGSHPPGSEVSALAHVLGDERTMPDHRGLFLAETFRMHPDVARFVSDIAYEGRLRSAKYRERQSVGGFAGLRFLAVDHVGNRVRSPEEAAVVAGLIDELVGTEWVDSDGASRPLTLEDLIVIAPYNAQVAELHRALPEKARVGTVDKFQGRQGSVAIYSMASSSAEDAPRGISFLYDLHRLNVAVSRAKALAIVVASPELLEVLCTRAEQVRPVNALCSFVALADIP